MYNYYTYRREKRKAISDLKKTRAKSSMVQRHNKLNDKLAENYKEKVKDFILNMAKSTYKVRDYKAMNKTSRELFLDENSKKIRAHQTFRFSAFETDKERINKLIREKIVHNEPFDYESAKKLFKKQNEIVLKRAGKIYYTILQPKMKFRSTSDIERFIDSNACSSKQKEAFRKLRQKTLESKSNGKDNSGLKKKILHEELKRMILQKNRYNSFVIDKNTNTKETINYKDTIFGLNKKKDIEERKETPENIEEQLNMEYNIKTTFKGAMTLASKYSSPEEIEARKKVFKKVKDMLSKSYNNIKPKRHKVPNLSSATFRTKEKQANFKKVANKILEGNLLGQVSEAFPLNPKNFDIFSSNPFLYFIESEHLKQNEIQNEKQALMNDFNLQEKLNYIKKIASKKAAPVKYKRERGDVNDVEKNMDMNVEEKITVGNEEVLIGETNLIAKKMLENCHYTTKKKIIRDGYENDRKKYKEEQDQWMLKEIERKKKMREEIIVSNKDFYE